MVDRPARMLLGNQALEIPIVRQRSLLSEQDVSMRLLMGGSLAPRHPE